jgi:hypothetical protein
MNCHNEFLCHSIGEKRENYLNKVKCILDRTSEFPCMGQQNHIDRSRPMIKYPGYVDKKNPKFNAPFFVPTVVNVPCKEVRPTSEIKRHTHENTRSVQYVDIKKLENSQSSRLVAGQMLEGCECGRRNGLQDSCPQPECQGRPECTQKPPTCAPSQKQELGPPQRMKSRREIISEGMRKKGGRQGHVCCCPPGGEQQPPQNYAPADCPHH